jgi:hypothetical protein
VDGRHAPPSKAGRPPGPSSAPLQAPWVTWLAGAPAASHWPALEQTKKKYRKGWGWGEVRYNRPCGGGGGGLARRERKGGGYLTMRHYFKVSIQIFGCFPSKCCLICYSIFVQILPIMALNLDQCSTNIETNSIMTPTEISRRTPVAGLSAEMNGALL